MPQTIDSEVPWVSENRQNDRQRGIFVLSKPFFPGKTCRIAGGNGAAQGKKRFCPGALTAFRYTLEKRVISSLNALQQHKQSENQADRRQRLYLCVVFRCDTLHK